MGGQGILEGLCKGEHREEKEMVSMKFILGGVSDIFIKRSFVMESKHLFFWR